MNEKIINIVEGIKNIKGEIKQIWVSNNCIFVESHTESENIEKVIYDENEHDSNEIYQIFNRLRYILNFNGMLNNDNIMI